MKKLFPVLSLLLLVVVSSCEKETIDQTEINSADFDITVTAKAEDEDPTEAELLERRMQWLSFLTAKVIADNAGHLSTFNSAIGPNNTISANTLFNGGSFSSFETQFRNTLLASLCNCGPDPDHDPDKPDKPIIPVGNGFAGESEKFAAFSDDTDPWWEATPEHYQAVEDFIDYITVENCIELYFPNGTMNLLSDNKYTTTAHPMTTAVSNDGFKRFIPPFSGAGCTGGCSDTVTVTDGYVNRNNNIIVARPKVTFVCTYSEYGLDFTIFLD